MSVATAIRPQAGPPLSGAASLPFRSSEDTKA